MSSDDNGSVQKCVVLIKQSEISSIQALFFRQINWTIMNSEMKKEKWKLKTLDNVIDSMSWEFNGTLHRSLFWEYEKSWRWMIDRLETFRVLIFIYKINIESWWEGSERETTNEIFRVKISQSRIIKRSSSSFFEVNQVVVIFALHESQFCKIFLLVHLLFVDSHSLTRLRDLFYIFLIFENNSSQWFLCVESKFTRPWISLSH